MAQRIDTSNFPAALQSIKTMAKTMENVTNTLNDYRSDITDSWVGKGRNQFEKSYTIMQRKLKDGSDMTWDIYENLIKAQGELMQADVDAAKASRG